MEEEGKGLKEGLKGERVSTSGKFPRRKNTRPPPTLLRLLPLQCKFHTPLLRVSTQMQTHALDMHHTQRQTPSLFCSAEGTQPLLDGRTSPGEELKGEVEAPF